MKPSRTLCAAIAAASIGLFAAAPAFAHDMAGMNMSGAGGSGASETSPVAAMGGRMMMGAHMTMTELRPETAADQARAQEIIATMRRDLSKYKDYKVAEADGYKPFQPTVPQDVYHFANRDLTIGEYLGDFDLAHPGSLLYEKRPLGGWKLIGAMYDGPPNSTPAQLDKLIPLGVGRWHAHTNICLPAGVTKQDVQNGNIRARMRPDISSAIDRPEGRSASIGDAVRMRFGYMADPRFGFAGTISTEAECTAVGGNFHKQIFGWMIHVYPFDSADPKVAFSTEAP